MSKKIYLFLADGFEEIEALGVVDVLKRAELQTVTVGVNKQKQQTGAHNIKVEADILFEDADFSDGGAFILPGRKKRCRILSSARSVLLQWH